jgi:hypothetical protein
MKNKTMTYVLGLVVAVVWGLIIYRIFDAASGNDDDAAPAMPSAIKKEAYNDYELPKDTSHLLLNYRDPFGLEKPKDTLEHMARRKVIANSLQTAAKPVFNWGIIQYSGFIRNPNTNKLVTMISINGKNELLAEGETKNQLKLIKNMGDSVKISYNGKTKFITIKP